MSYEKMPPSGILWRCLHIPRGSETTLVKISALHWLVSFRGYSPFQGYLNEPKRCKRQLTQRKQGVLVQTLKRINELFSIVTLKLGKRITEYYLLMTFLPMDICSMHVMI